MNSVHPFTYKGVTISGSWQRFRPLLTEYLILLPDANCHRKWIETQISYMAVGCHHFLSAPPLPSHSKSITASWPIPNHTAWWQRHTGVGSLPKATTWWCPARWTRINTITLQSKAEHLPMCIFNCSCDLDLDPMTLSHWWIWPRYTHEGVVVALQVERRTSDREVAGSTLTRALLAQQP